MRIFKRLFVMKDVTACEANSISGTYAVLQTGSVMKGLCCTLTMQQEHPRYAYGGCFVLMWTLLLRSINPNVIASSPYAHRRQSLELMCLTQY